MKKLSLLKSALLLCALVVGSGSVWAQTAILEEDFSQFTTSSTTALTSLTSGTASWSDVKNVYKEVGYIKFSSSNKLGSMTTPVLSDLDGNATLIFKLRKYSTETATLKLTINNGGTIDGESSLTISTESLAQNAWEWHSIAIEDGTSSTTIKFESTYKRFYLDDIAIVTPATATFGTGKTMISFSNADYALDLATANLPSGLAAYKVTEATNSAVTLTAVNSTVAAGTGVILTGTAGESYNIPVVATGTDISASNLLEASDGTFNVQNAYVLSSGKFHPVQAAGIVIPAGKAYLPAGSITSSHALDIEFADGETTGIQSLESQKNLLEGAFYNLAGQRVAQPTKGLYIVNGRKVIIK